MTNWKAELEVSEAEMMLRQRHWICVREWADSRANDFVKGETVPTERTMLAVSRMEEELTALLRAVAASGSPPSPTREQVEAVRHFDITRDGDEEPPEDGEVGQYLIREDVLALFDLRASSGSPPSMPTRWWCESCGAVMTCTTANGDIICEHKHIVASCIPEVRASSGSTGAPSDQPTPEETP